MGILKRKTFAESQDVMNAFGSSSKRFSEASTLVTEEDKISLVSDF